MKPSQRGHLLSWAVKYFGLSWLSDFCWRVMVTSVRRQGYELTASLETISGRCPSHGKLVWSMLLLSSSLKLRARGNTWVHGRLERWKFLQNFGAFKFRPLFRGKFAGLVSGRVSFGVEATGAMFNFPQVQNTWRRGTMSWRRSFSCFLFGCFQK